MSIVDLPDSVWDNLNPSFVQKDIRDLSELNKVSRNTFPFAIVVPYLTTKIIYVNGLWCDASEHMGSLHWMAFCLSLLLLYHSSNYYIVCLCLVGFV